MIKITVLLWIAATLLAGAAPVEIPSGINHEPYNRLLGKYVNDRGLINYRAWTESPADRNALREYVAQFAGAGAAAEGAAKSAALINAYNALTIQWLLENYPVKSIKNTKDPWGAKRHKVGSRLVSLDEIEHDTLRPQIGYRIHAVLVCAARSCPPLRSRAYSADKLDEQLDDAMRRWLARDDLNRFQPEAKRAELSKIFSWYGEDFQKTPGGLSAVLEKYAPVKCSDCKLSYQSYNWTLNEQ